MNPQLKALVTQANRFLRGAGFSLPKALCLTALALLSMAILAGTLTFVAVWGMSEVFLSIVNMSAGGAVGGAWIPKKFGLLAGVGMFFFLTVGILLTIDELRGWLIRLLCAGVILAAMGGIYGAFLPLVTTNAVAQACLIGVILSTGGAGILILVLFSKKSVPKSAGAGGSTTEGNQGGASKILSVLSIVMGAGLVISLLWGGNGNTASKKTSSASAATEIILTAAHPEEWVELQPGQASLPVIAPGSKSFDGVSPSDPDSCLARVVVNSKGPQRQPCPWPDNIRTAGWVGPQERIQSYEVIAGTKPARILFTSSW